MTKLRHIKYDSLNTKQKEIYNFQKLAAILADYGFNCIKLHDDWKGADFLAYHKDGKDTLKIQLKAWLAIDKKYIRQDIYMAFPVRNKETGKKDWYLIAHNELVKIMRKHTTALTTNSWKVEGRYSTSNPSKLVLKAIQFARLTSKS